jgi:type IV pilus assembly protein PilM
MAKQRVSPIGFHLDQRTVTLVQLVRNGDSLEIHDLAHGEVPPPNEATPVAEDAALVSTLKSLIAGHRFRGRNVVSCLGSRELFVQNVRLPKAAADELEKMVLWEAAERLPYPLDEAEVRHLTAGEVRQDANVKQEVILLASQQQALKRHIAVLEAAGLTPQAIDVEPCALLRSLRRTDSVADEPRKAYIHLGAKSTGLIIADTRDILFLKYIHTGGQNWDEAIARHIDLPIADAAKMRELIAAAPVLNDQNEIHRTIVEAIREPLEGLGSEIELCLRYYKVTFRGSPLDKVVLTGSQAAPWLTDFFGKRLSLPCELGNPLLAVQQVPATALDRPGRWTLAMGLCLKAI